MSGNGKQVQLAPGQPQRYTISCARPPTPQRNDAFHVQQGGVAGNYAQGGGAQPGHTQHLQGGLRGPLPLQPLQPPTPPQQDMKAPLPHAYSQVRAQPSYSYRGGPPQPQPVPPRATHHRQQPGMYAPGSGGQMIYAPPLMYTHIGLPPPQYGQQPAPRQQYYQQPGSMPSMLSQPHAYAYGSFPNQQAQQQYYIQAGSAPSSGAMTLGTAQGRSAGGVSSAPNVPQPTLQQQHPMMTNRYTPAMQPQPPHKRRIHAVPIVDPKSGKDIMEMEENLEADTSSESGDRNPSQPDGNSLAVVEEFARKVSDAANEKDIPDNSPMDTKSTDLENSNCTPLSKGINITNPATSEESSDTKLIDNDMEEKLMIKRNPINETADTPVVSAISNSPEIVPKQCTTQKQKQVENIPQESKKIHTPKVAKQNKQPIPEAIVSDKSNNNASEVTESVECELKKSVVVNKTVIEEIKIDGNKNVCQNVSVIKDTIKHNQPSIVTGKHEEPVPNQKPTAKKARDENKITQMLQNEPANVAKKATSLETVSKEPSPPHVKETINQQSTTQKSKHSSKKERHRSAANEKPIEPQVQLVEPPMDTNPVEVLEKIVIVSPKPVPPVIVELPTEVEAPKEVEIEILPIETVQTPEPEVETVPSLSATAIEINKVVSKMEALLIMPCFDKDKDKDKDKCKDTIVMDTPIAESKDDTPVPIQPEPVLSEPIEVPPSTEEVEAVQVVAEEVESKIKDEDTSPDSLDEKVEVNKVTTSTTVDTEVETTTNGPELSSTPVLRYSYKDDQWSPVNTSGRKYYDTEFLYMLRDNPNSKKKPENIAKLDIVADGVNRQSRGPSDATRSVAALTRTNDLLPGYARGPVHSATPNRKSQHGKPSSKGNLMIGSGGKPNVIHVNLSLRSDVKLNEAENAWKPTRNRNINLEDEEVATQELYKTLRSVLNKLTPQKFDTLIDKVRKLNIDSTEKLTGVINLVFEKAIDEPNFSVGYALMCKELEQIQVKLPTENSKGEKFVSFRNLIVNRCQAEFEKEDDSTSKIQREIDACTDPEKKNELILNLEEEERRIRRRSVGNVRFIGELFKQNIIVTNIVVHCIKRLLTKVEEETLECLCKLLTTIGKDLEKSNISLQPYFNTMQSIADSKHKVNSRVKFMLQDVIDLRRNSWIPRQQVSNPRTMDQIKLEAEMEQKNSMYSNFASPSGMRKDDRPSNMLKRGGSKSVTEEGWLTAPSRTKAKQQPFVVDSTKLSKMVFVTPITQTSLQPSNKFGYNVSGKSATTNKKPESSPASHKSSGYNTARKLTTETSNMYTALDSQYSDNISLPSSTGAAKKISYRSKGASIERSTFKSDSGERSPTPQDQDSMEGIPDKVRKMMKQACNDNVYGVLDKIQSTFSNFVMPSVIRELLLWGLEFNKIENMQIVGEVTGRLVDDKIISGDEYLKVLKQTMDSSQDYFLKGGKNFWQMLASYVWAHMIKHDLNLRQIHTAFSKVIEVERGFDFLSYFIVQKLKVSKPIIQALWENSNMKLSDWMDENNVEQFLEEMPFFQSLTEGSKPIEKMTQEAACAEMLQLMREKIPRDTIKAWIHEKIGEEVQDSWFIRALTEAIYTYTLCPDSGSTPRFDEEAKARHQQYYPLLIIYVDSQKNRELQCLFAIQHLINKLQHPQGITSTLFEYLWDSGEVLSTDGFISWELDKHPHEQEGKGVMLKTLTSFFTALKSCESSDENDEY